MSDLVEAIQKVHCRGCFVDHCSQHGCSISLEGTPNRHAVIDFDTPESPLGPEEKRCDYLFVCNGEKGIPGYVVQIEMTRGKTKKATYVRDQLQAGTKVADESIPAEIPVTFCPGVRWKTE